MTWTTTIAAFLGTVVAVGIILFLFSERNRIRDALKKAPKRRIETRTSARVGLELFSMDGPIHEITFTKNVSRHGACALTKNRWMLNSSVQVRLLREDVRERARIAYCKKMGDVFAIGLQFSAAIAWQPPRSA